MLDNTDAKIYILMRASINPTNEHSSQVSEIAMNKQRKWNATGAIKKQLPFESDLSAKYYEFLMRLDPLLRWEDIQPLEESIKSPKGYRLDPDVETTFGAMFPNALSELKEAEDWGDIASRLGIRYAWTRVHMHMKILRQFDDLLDKNTVVIEPGCSSGGLIHFLPEARGVKYLGVDCSPVALDVCRSIETTNKLSGKRILARANFYAFSETHLESFELNVRNTVVLFSNFLNNAKSIWSVFPCVEPAIVAAWLVSYWVRAGATVLICERCDDAQKYVKYLSDFGLWGDGATGLILDEFDTISTTAMTPENPIGDWSKSHCVIAKFHS